MLLEKIHQAFKDQKAVKIHDEIILYVRGSPGRLYFTNGQRRLILDKELTPNEIAQPADWYPSLVIRAAFSWHIPIDKKTNMFTLLSSFPADIEVVSIPLDIDKVHSFDLSKNPYQTMNIVLDVPELSPINLVGAKDKTPLMRVFGKYADVLSREHINECKLLSLIYQIIKLEGRKVDVLHI